MKKITKIAIAVATALLLTTQAQAGYSLKKKIGDVNTKMVLFGFSQLEARGGDGQISSTQNASVKFGAQRVRLGVKYFAGPLRGKLFLDFNQPYNYDKHTGIGVPKVVKDAFISYYVSNALAIKLGAIKMPHGMGFTIPGWNLDVVERGFDKKLALERNMGLMLSGRAIGGSEGQKVNGLEMGHDRAWDGFGYDIMIGNQAARSGAVKGEKRGDANSYAARVMYDAGDALHTELSYVVSEDANGTGSNDYKSLNFGVDSHFGAGNVKFEMYRSQNVQGEAGWDINTYAFTGTYYTSPTLELALKHIQGKASRNNKDTSIGNTYVGFNYYIAPFDAKMSRGAKKKRNAHRIQVNYVLASGDTNEKNKKNDLLSAYTENSWLVQYQYKF